jgi:hypothetical protein
MPVSSVDGPETPPATSRAILLFAAEVRKQVVAYGPLITSDRARADSALSRYRKEEFGHSNAILANEGGGVDPSPPVRALSLGRLRAAIEKRLLRWIERGPASWKAEQVSAAGRARPPRRPPATLGSGWSSEDRSS